MTVSGLAFVTIAVVSGRASIRMAVLAAALMIIPPPFFWPAVGVMILMLRWLTAQDRLQARRTD